MTPRNGSGRQVAVRLTDVPLKVRRRHGARLYEAAVLEADLAMALAIENAIERPSDRVYWLPEAKVRQVLK